MYEEKQLSELGEKLETLSNKNLIFLSPHNTHESSLEQSSHMVEDVLIWRSWDVSTLYFQETTVALSQKSSSYSSCSYVLSVHWQKRLSLEAAKTRLDFVKKENAVKIHVELEELGVQIGTILRIRTLLKGR